VDTANIRQKKKKEKEKKRGERDNACENKLILVIF
jgi:hypothetical protein